LTTQGNYAEIARSLNLPPGTVRSRMHRARKALAKLRRDDSHRVE
jgi:DNA-directed RNA polymerase specialized sigma24 family protein